MVNKKWTHFTSKFPCRVKDLKSKSWICMLFFISRQDIRKDLERLNLSNVLSLKLWVF